MEITVGSYVEVELITLTGEAEPYAFDIVSDELADLKNGFLGASTLLARTVMGHSAGDTLDYLLDDIVSVRILKVQASSRQADQSVVERRQETLRKAVAQSDHTNAVVFASSFTGKWGDYDPSTLKED